MRNLLGRRPRSNNLGEADPRRPVRSVVLLSLGLVLLVVAYVLVLVLSRPSSPGQELRYDELINDARANRIQTATVLTYDRRIVGTLDTGEYWVAFGGTVEGNPLFAQLLTGLSSAHVPITIDQQWSKGLITPLTILMPTLILVDALLLVFLMVRRDTGGLQSFGRSRGRHVGKSGDAKVTFGDVAGVQEAVEELQEIRDYLSNPSRFLTVGARVPSGILLVGPPGCGKTLLARAVAGEAGVPFFSMSGSDFVEIYVGVGAARIRDLFRQAREAAPAIIFIDELDAVGRGRTTSAVAGQDEREATLNQLLVGLDGFESETGVVVLAATNRPDVLDPALLRPGRFDRRVFVEVPDVHGRLGVLKVHTRGMPLAGDTNLDILARRTAGFSGADLASLVNEAALLAARRGSPDISQALLSEAVERVMAGPERKSRLLTARDKELIAYHEGGHAVVSAILHPADRVTKISIVARGRGGGFTWFVADEEQQLATRTQLRARLAAMMGGRAAEELVSGDLTTGAQDDLERATDLARRMVCELGMSDQIGPVSLRTTAARMMADGEAAQHSNEITTLVDNEIRELLVEARNIAFETLEKHRAMLDRLVNRLLEVESLEGEDLERLLYPALELAATS
ncbi:MAG: ATP-dependent zinc metalloprotease FtsH [Candidatus Dormibacteria bacterium]